MSLLGDAPDVPLIAFEDVQLQNSASRNRVSWQLTQDSFIPAAFRIERKIAAGAWTEIESAYAMSDPFTGYKMGGINRNFYYIDDGLTTSGTYQYRINSTAISNIVTKTGTTYYVANGGDNGWDGLYGTYQGGTSGPWETMAYANPNANSTGDLVLFKRGDTWTEGRVTFTNGGTSDNPVTWADYDSGNAPHLRLATSGAYGFNLTDIAYRNLEFCKFSATLGVAAIIMFRSTNATRMCTGNKVMNCEVDVDNATTGAGGGIFMYHTENTAVVPGTGLTQGDNYDRDYHVEYPEISYCYIHESAARSSLRSHDCRKNAWYHNNFVDGGSSGITVSGGDDHTVEYNEIKGGTYASHANSGSKANSQIYWLNRMTYRRNLIYYTGSTNYGLSLQSAKDALVEYNTVFDNGTTYAGFWCLTDPDQGVASDHWAEGGNIVRNNIFAGGKDTQGAVRINIGDMETGGGNWYDHIDFYDNCISEAAGSIIELDDPYSKINTHPLFVSNWNNKYPDDIHDDPEFTDETTGDFTLQSGSPAEEMGYTAASIPADFYGQNIVENGLLQAWDNDDVGEPDDWHVYDGINRVGDAVQIYTTGDLKMLYRSFLTASTKYYLEFEILEADSGSLAFTDGSNTEYDSWDTPGLKKLRFTARDTGARFSRKNSGETTDVTFTNISIQPIVSTPLYHDVDFESGLWADKLNETTGNEGDYTINVVSDIVDTGTYALKLQHSIKGTSWNRVELNFNGINDYWWKKGYWYAARIYLQDWKTNPCDWNNITQCHTTPWNKDWVANPQAGDNCWTLFANKAGYKGDAEDVLKFHSQVMTLNQALTEIPTTAATGPHSWVIPVPENQWFTVVVNWKSSHLSDGFMKFWYNGQLVVNQSGPNTHYLDTDANPRYQGNQLHFGDYKEHESTNERIIRFDNARVAGDQATYADVAP